MIMSLVNIEIRRFGLDNDKSHNKYLASWAQEKAREQHNLCYQCTIFFEGKLQCITFEGLNYVQMKSTTVYGPSSMAQSQHYLAQKQKNILQYTINYGHVTLGYNLML